MNLDKGPDHVRVGIRVKGLGSGGRLAGYECPDLDLNVEVYGEILAEVKGNLNLAAKQTTITAKAGPLNMQSDMYEEEKHAERNGKCYFEFFGGGACSIEWELCLVEELEKGRTGDEAEANCTPVSLVGVVTGPLNADGPAVLNGQTQQKTREAFLIEDD